MRDLEYVHYDPRQSNQSEEIRKMNRKTKKTQLSRKERPKTATSTRMKQKRGKGAVAGQRRRPKSASYERVTAVLLIMVSNKLPIHFCVTLFSAISAYRIFSSY